MHVRYHIFKSVRQFDTSIYQIQRQFTTQYTNNFFFVSFMQKQELFHFAENNLLKVCVLNKYQKARISTGVHENQVLTLRVVRAIQFCPIYRFFLTWYKKVKKYQEGWLQNEDGIRPIRYFGNIKNLEFVYLDIKRIMLWQIFHFLSPKK